MSWPAVKRAFKQEDFRQYVSSLTWPSWRPSRIVWHNTAAPSLAQWIRSADADRAAGLIPGSTRIANLESFFRFDNHWSGCPHLFVANDAIWVMNPLTSPGVHSPSFNNTSIGIECVGDFDMEDDDSGEGLKVKNNLILATAVLCAALGIEPTFGQTDKPRRRIIGGTIFIHKDDWATTHDCPGIDLARDKNAMISAVCELMEGGEHDPALVAAVIAGLDQSSLPGPVRCGVVTTNGLNVRRGPGVSNEVSGVLNKGIEVTILKDAPNGENKWLQIKSPAGYTGWVAARFVDEKGA